MIARRRFTTAFVISFTILLLWSVQHHYLKRIGGRWTETVEISSPRSFDRICQSRAPTDRCVDHEQHTETDPPLREGNATLLEKAPTYVQAILDPQNTAFERLQCSGPNDSRYAKLRSTTSSGSHTKKYYFTLLLHECVELLPRLLGSVVEAIEFLGKDNCMLSIVEGRSNDGTFEVLKLLHQSLRERGIDYILQGNDDTEPKDDNRIQALADLRNIALQPLLKHRIQFSPDSTVIFLNDVAICPDDILELVHQRQIQGADMTCAMDWTHPGPDPLFYDVWIARGITGDTFFPIGDDGNWDGAANLFWNDPTSLSRLNDFKPFQVFACWNGGTAFAAAPILSGKIHFRTNHDKECFSGEPHLFCKDMWAQGFGKIAVVPSVNLQYTDANGKRIKEQKGYVKDLIQKQIDAGNGDELISWQKEPPQKLKCMPGFTMQDFRPWDEGLIGHDPV